MSDKKETVTIFRLEDDRAEKERAKEMQKKNPYYLVPQMIPMAWECSQCHKQYDQHDVDKQWRYCPCCGRKIAAFDDGQDMLW